MILVAISSGAGGALRFLVGRWVLAQFGAPPPLATGLVNLVGCGLIGYVSGLASRHGGLSPEAALMLTTGFCGGFTTFSAFAWENLQLLRSGSPLPALAYMLTSVGLGILAAWAGLRLASPA
jgi:CrcB protein